MVEIKKKVPHGFVAKYPFHHVMPMQIRFNDLDMLGHVNNAIYFQYFDLGKMGYLKAVRGAQIDWKTVDIVVANISCDFLAPVFYNEELEVRTQVDRILKKSFPMLQQVVNSVTGEVKCACTTIMVNFDIKLGKSKPLSDYWIDALTKFEGHNLQQTD